ncbi:Uncharacterised protein [Mycobacteroides abscessus subsp. abscessus]|nr:Uncharacterised protein [Mycobacteroides abscessus subsp. abscessus]
MPTPMVAPPEAMTIAFDLTARPTFHAKTKSARVSASAAAPATSVQLAGSSPSASSASRSWTSRPPLIWRHSVLPDSGCAARSSRTFFLRLSTSTAPSAYPGATITSVKMSATRSAISTLTSRLTAITPPNALNGSHSCALRCASAIEMSDTAIPHGLACLMIAAHALS